MIAEVERNCKKIDNLKKLGSMEHLKRNMLQALQSMPTASRHYGAGCNKKKAKRADVVFSKEQLQMLGK